MSTGGTILVELCENIEEFEAALIDRGATFSKSENDITTDYKIEYNDPIDLFYIGANFGVRILDYRKMKT